MIDIICAFLYFATMFIMVVLSINIVRKLNIFIIIINIKQFSDIDDTQMKEESVAKAAKSIPKVINIII